MKVNGITSESYKCEDGILSISLKCNYEDALAFNASLVEVKTDDDDLVDAFVGYQKKRIISNLSTGEIVIECVLVDDSLQPVLNEFENKLLAQAQQIENQADVIEEMLALLAGENDNDDDAVEEV
jgi:hypothetical protein